MARLACGLGDFSGYFPVSAVDRGWCFAGRA
jgi:hypothetical protein